MSSSQAAAAALLPHAAGVGSQGAAAAAAAAHTPPSPWEVMRGLTPLETAAQSFAPDPHCITPAHPAFLQLCLASKRYQQAADFLDRTPIYQVDPVKTGMVALDLLRYFYYAGMVFVGLQRYGDACDCFRTVLATPAHALSAIAVESYKKLLLISALLPSSAALPTPSADSSTSSSTSAAAATAGTTAGAQSKALLPKNTPLVISRSIRQTSLFYHDLLTAAQAGNAEGVKALIEKHAEALMADSNLGLARQVGVCLSSVSPSLRPSFFVFCFITSCWNAVAGIC